MTQAVIVVLFAGRAGSPCRELVLKTTGKGRPSHVLPIGAASAYEAAEHAAARVALELGCLVPPALWVDAGPARGGDARVLTARVPLNAFTQLKENPKLRVDSAELTLCDAWVNMKHYEPDFLALLAQARRAH